MKSTKIGKVGSKKEALKYFLRDAHDRFFTVESDGASVELEAGVRKEVTKEAADILKAKYEYLEVITE